MDTIKHIILISGKRKSGKDYLAERLQKRLGDERSQIIRISAPIKAEWSKRLNLDYQELLSDGQLKEQHRRAMIEWSDDVRRQDYGYFCRAAMSKACQEIIIVSDVRRKKDIKFFQESYGCRVHTLRLICPEAIRSERGWLFTSGIDDVESECGLDDYHDWHLVLDHEKHPDTNENIHLIIKAFQLE